jgi:hypothetical protein
VDTRAGVDDLEKRKFFTLPGLELPSLSRPTRSQSLYRLRCGVIFNPADYVYVHVGLREPVWGRG